MAKKQTKQRNRKASPRTRQRVRRNVKKQKEGFWFPTPLATILSVATVLCLGYLWLCGTNESLSTDIRKLEYELDQARKASNNEEYKWKQTVTPKSLKKQIARFDIDMIFPNSEQVIAAGSLDRWVPPVEELLSETYQRANLTRP